MVIHETNCYRLYWHNEAKSRIVLHVLHPWTWDAAFDAIHRSDAAVGAQAHPVYTIFHFEPGTAILPRNSSIDNVRRLMTTTDLQNEKLVILAFQGTTFRLILSAIGHRLPVWGKLRFVASLDEGLAIADAHEQSGPPSYVQK